MPNFTIPNPATRQDLDNIILSILQNLPTVPQVVTVVPANPASTTYTYVVVAKQYGQVYPVSTTVTTGAASMSSTNYNTISWSAFTPPIPPPSNAASAVLYDVYRTAGGTTQGKILSNYSPQQLGPLSNAQDAVYGGGGLPGGISFNSGASNALALVDNGIAGDGTTPPAFPSFGQLAVNVVESLQVAAASGAINIAVGTVLITDGAAAALTLAQPIAGAPASGGQDGSVLLITSVTAFAHTVTTPNTGINPSHHVLTFGAAAGNYVTLIAYNGLWYVGPSLNVTAS